jgi:TPR repeat protein
MKSMPKTSTTIRRRPKIGRTTPLRKATDDLFLRASAAREAEEDRRAFRLFLAAARAGDVGALLNVGLFYDEGIGVRMNHKKALELYRRAYRRGNGGAANNIGIMMRNRGQVDRALAWFQRAVRAGSDDSNLHLAEIYEVRGDIRRAIAHLKRLRRSNMVTEMTRATALRRLRRLEGHRRRRSVG